MYYNFDTDDENEAKAALLVYCVYRSRDMQRFKVTPDMWAQIERFVKASAKRAKSLGEFLESLKPRLSCGTINPKWMNTGTKGMVGITDDEGFTSYIQAGDQREFLTGLIRTTEAKPVLRLLYRETTLIIQLVRVRLEAEKPIEQKLYSEIEG